MTKRELLLAICDTPGWVPPDDAPPSIALSLGQLIREGWVLPRLDGYEGSPQALDAYPTFLSQADVADPNAPAAPEGVVTIETVTLDRVTCLLVAILCEVPLITVFRMTSMTPSGLPPDKALWAVARQAAHRL